MKVWLHSVVWSVCLAMTLGCQSMKPKGGGGGGGGRPMRQANNPPPGPGALKDDQNIFDAPANGGGNEALRRRIDDQLNARNSPFRSPFNQGDLGDGNVEILDDTGHAPGSLDSLPADPNDTGFVDPFLADQENRAGEGEIVDPSTGVNPTRDPAEFAETHGIP